MARRRITSLHTPSAAPVIASSVILSALGLTLAWVAHSRNSIAHDLPLTRALDGELRFVDSAQAGRLALYTAGARSRNRTPVLLLHSVNAAASSFEMRPLFDRLARTRKVFALDLPGFGFSDRGARAYTPALMRDAVIEAARVAGKGGPVDVVALSLSGEFLALAAAQAPALFRTLTFISPTGMESGPGARRPRPVLLRALSQPGWRRPLFDLLTTRASLRYFLRGSARAELPRAVAEYAYLSSHQPGAEYAPLSFVAGMLFTPRINEQYQALKQPALLIHGRESASARYSLIDALLERRNWQVAPFSRAGALTHWDYPETACARIEQHLAQPG